MRNPPRQGEHQFVIILSPRFPSSDIFQYADFSYDLGLWIANHNKLHFSFTDGRFGLLAQRITTCLGNFRFGLAFKGILSVCSSKHINFIN